MLLLKALSGSRLYGTNRPDSDWDWIEIHDRLPGRKQVKQTITDDRDVLAMSFSEWTRLLDKGTHQAIEAVLAPAIYCPVNLISDYRRAYRLNVPGVVNTYQRTMKAMNQSKPKQRAHYRRLQFNLDDLMEFGTFNPRLSPERVAAVLA